MISCFKGNFRVTSPYGERILNGNKEFHKGIDLVGLDSITVYSVSDGIVRTAYQANGAGNYVVVTMNDGRRIFYMHLKSFLVKNGQRVKRGDAIGVMGNTGNSFGAHTHLEIRPEGTTYDNLDICEFTNIPNKTGVYYYKEEELLFSDLHETHWAYKPVNELYKENIIKGYEDKTFKPDNFITRAEFVAAIVRCNKEYNENTDYTVGKHFSDVNKSDWYSNYLGFALTKGFVEGYADGTFKGQNYISRAESATIISKVMGW